MLVCWLRTDQIKRKTIGKLECSKLDNILHSGRSALTDLLIHDDYRRIALAVPFWIAPLPARHTHVLESGFGHVCLFRNAGNQSRAQKLVFSFR